MKVNVWAILFAVAVIFFVVLQIKSCQQAEYYSGILTAKQDTVRTWQDEAGRWRVEAMAAQVTNEDLKQFFAQEARQIQEDFDLKLKRVTSYLQVTTLTRDTVLLKTDSSTTITIRNPDGSDTARFQYSDQWAQFDVTLRGRALSLLYQVRDSVSFVTSNKKLGIFGPQRLVLDGISYNQNTKITGITNIEITPPNRRWSVGPYAGYGWSGAWGFSAGISVQYSLLKF